MELTIFLAKVIGWYFVIVSLFMLTRQEATKSLIADVLAQRALLFFMGIVTLIIGLLLVLSHNVWVMGWPVIITLIGWLVLISGILRLTSSKLTTKIGNWWLKNPAYLVVAAVIYLLIGLYLLYMAYF
ncbi:MULTISPECIES: hypothetical protein [unclassified Legionella]|uniref:hypothetical protein n=1 Tax=unclassified Legionella TaxID=2622702 RepID=UPI001054841D|nr:MULTISPECIES: hypothetical protein [unclassified Legionella]MDI9818727.1 hypothetical protein [Legionella sp. PL877]